MEEMEFYRHGDVSVTNARFIVGSSTYAMNGVTSVKRGQTSPSKVAPVVLGLISLVGIFSAHDGGKIVAVLFLLLAIFWFKRISPEYIVSLNSSSGESQALRSKDKHYIDEVINALNQSIIHRG